MPDIFVPNFNEPIVDEQGCMTDNFQRWINLIVNTDLIINSGSPEGVVEATVGRLYMDDTGSTGSILYIKKLADISGDRTKGWLTV